MRGSISQPINLIWFHCYTAWKEIPYTFQDLQEFLLYPVLSYISILYKNSLHVEAIYIPSWSILVVQYPRPQSTSTAWNSVLPSPFVKKCSTVLLPSACTFVSIKTGYINSARTFGVYTRPSLWGILIYVTFMYSKVSYLARLTILWSQTCTD